MVPVDAVPLIGSGVLDRRLFNIDKLIEYGYHDAASDRLPLIVAYPDGVAARRDGPPLAGRRRRACSAPPSPGSPCRPAAPPRWRRPWTPASTPWTATSVGPGRHRW
ncbi:hypothetical protein [Micromonospora radicis]|uniref:hypothetical protein n=1 Tax=Micromonospora radicis TaxID=1894971 RepID=UPI0011C3AD61|nr:hypothetical protein [Micromonospora radicis]